VAARTEFLRFCAVPRAQFGIWPRPQLRNWHLNRVVGAEQVRLWLTWAAVGAPCEGARRHREDLFARIDDRVAWALVNRTCSGQQNLIISIAFQSKAQVIKSDPEKTCWRVQLNVDGSRYMRSEMFFSRKIPSPKGSVSSSGRCLRTA
jgi:hypothetical protein